VGRRTKLHSVSIRYVKTEFLPAVHLGSATLVIHPSEPVVKIMKFISLLNSTVDGVQAQASARPKKWVLPDACVTTELAAAAHLIEFLDDVHIESVLLVYLTTLVVLCVAATTKCKHEACQCP
jgi:hypothetical protein